MFRHLFILTLLTITTGCSDSEPAGVDSGDAQVIEALKDEGSDLAKLHPIDFYFVEFADRASAERMSQELTQPNWKLDVHQSPESSSWTVIASTVMVPDIQAISRLSAKFNAIAPKYGGDYDGWEAAVTR